MFLCMSFSALSFPRLAKALTVSQPVKGCSPVRLSETLSPNDQASLVMSTNGVRFCFPLFLYMESKKNQHDIGVFGCDYYCLRTSFSSMQCIQKQTSVCFFLCGVQLRHFHPSICCHLGTGFFAGHIQCPVLQHISVSLYCPLANQELFEARLVEGTAREFSQLLYVVSSCQEFVLNGCACTSV